jgi:hypothetical protein
MTNIFRNQKDKGEVNFFTLTVLLIGIFIGLTLIFYFGGLTIIRIDTIFNFVIVCGTVAFIIHLPFLKTLNRYMAEIIAYSYLGWGFIFTAAFFSLNFIFHKVPETDIYSLDKVELRYNNGQQVTGYSIKLGDYSEKTYHVSSSAYKEFPYLLEFEGSDELKFYGQPQLAEITTASGWFGYSVILHKELR